MQQMQAVLFKQSPSHTVMATEAKLAHRKEGRFVQVFLLLIENIFLGQQLLLSLFHCIASEQMLRNYFLDCRLGKG